MEGFAMCAKMVMGPGCGTVMPVNGTATFATSRVVSHEDLLSADALRQTLLGALVKGETAGDKTHNVWDALDKGIILRESGVRGGLGACLNAPPVPADW